MTTAPIVEAMSKLIFKKTRLHFDTSWPSVACSTPHRAFLECELCWEVHAGGQPKGICIEHGIVWVESLGCTGIR